MPINYRTLNETRRHSKALYKDHLITTETFEAGTTVLLILRAGETETQRLSNLLKVKQPTSHEARIQTQAISLRAHSPYASSHKRTARFQGSKSQAF